MLLPKFVAVLDSLPKHPHGLGLLLPKDLGSMSLLQKRAVGLGF